MKMFSSQHCATAYNINKNNGYNNKKWTLHKYYLHPKFKKVKSICHIFYKNKCYSLYGIMNPVLEDFLFKRYESNFGEMERFITELL